MHKLKTIHLYGKLKEVCDNNDTVELCGNDIRTIVSGLISNFGPKVKRYIRENKFLIKFKDPDSDKFLTEDTLDWSFGSEKSIHILPEIEGSGRIGTIVLGAALIGAAIFTGGATLFGSQALATAASGALASAGVSLVIGGLFPPASPRQREEAQSQPSFTFNRAANMTEQGHPVPLCYGFIRTGSIVLSTGVQIEQLATTTSPPGSGGGGSGGGGVVSPNPIFQLQ